MQKKQESEEEKVWFSYEWKNDINFKMNTISFLSTTQPFNTERDQVITSYTPFDFLVQLATIRTLCFPVYTSRSSATYWNHDAFGN